MGRSTGVLDASFPSGFVALVRRSQTDSRGDFLHTAFLGADPTPTIFPEIVHRSGYVVEFIVLSANGPASITLSLYGADGTPLPVGK